MADFHADGVPVIRSDDRREHLWVEANRLRTLIRNARRLDPSHPNFGEVEGQRLAHEAELARIEDQFRAIPIGSIDQRFGWTPDQDLAARPVMVERREQNPVDPRTKLPLLKGRFFVPFVKFWGPKDGQAAERPVSDAEASCG